MYLSTKQRELMRVIAMANPSGEPTDLDQIIERVSYKPTKCAIHFSIRALIKHGLIEKLGMVKRRDRNRVLIALTKLGRDLMVPTAGVATSVEEDELFEEMMSI